MNNPVEHPNIATWWLVLRSMALASLVGLLVMAAAAFQVDISDAQGSLLEHIAYTLASVIFFYVAAATGSEITSMVRRP